MGERKVLNKYIPPDYDPLSVPRMRRPKDEQIKVRMMLPMTICCKTCGNFICKGTKFNTRKEDVEGPEGKYLGIQIFRFYFKCTRCGAELAMKTDPQNSDYVMEAGATRNFEPWRDPEAQKDVAKAQREAEEAGDSMKALENRTLDSKREMDILSALDEMKSLNARHFSVTSDQMLAAIHGQEGEAGASAEPPSLDEGDEELVQKMLKAKQAATRRIDDDADLTPAPLPKRARVDGPEAAGPSASREPEAPTPAPPKPAPSAPTFAVRAKPVKMVVKAKAKAPEPTQPVAPSGGEAGGDNSDSDDGGGLMGLMGAYGSDSD